VERLLTSAIRQLRFKHQIVRVMAVGVQRVAGADSYSSEPAARVVQNPFDALTSDGASLRIVRIAPELPNRDHRHLLDECVPIALGIDKSTLDKPRERFINKSSNFDAEALHVLDVNWSLNQNQPGSLA
jgi:hypothetical protein